MSVWACAQLHSNSKARQEERQNDGRRGRAVPGPSGSCCLVSQWLREATTGALCCSMGCNRKDTRRNTNLQFAESSSYSLSCACRPTPAGAPSSDLRGCTDGREPKRSPAAPGRYTHWVIDAAMVAATPPSQNGYGCFFSGAGGGARVAGALDGVDMACGSWCYVRRPVSGLGL